MAAITISAPEITGVMESVDPTVILSKVATIRTALVDDLSTTLAVEICGIVAGDNAPPLRYILLNVPAAISRAWLTVKRHQWQTDREATFQKQITATDHPGIGEIEDDGATGAESGIARLRFDLPAAVTALLTYSKGYYLDIQVKAGGNLYTPVRGTITAKSQFTRTT